MEFLKKTPRSSGLNCLVSYSFSKTIYSFHFKGLRADPNTTQRLRLCCWMKPQKWISLVMSRLVSQKCIKILCRDFYFTKMWRAPLWSQRCQGHVSERLHQSQRVYGRKALQVPIGPAFRGIRRRFPVPTCCIVHVSGFWIRVTAHPNPLSITMCAAGGKLICFQFWCFLAIVTTLRLSCNRLWALKPMLFWRNTKKRFHYSFSPSLSILGYCCSTIFASITDHRVEQSQTVFLRTFQEKHRIMLHI